MMPPGDWWKRIKHQKKLRFLYIKSNIKQKLQLSCCEVKTSVVFTCPVSGCIIKPLWVFYCSLVLLVSAITSAGLCWSRWVSWTLCCDGQPQLKTLWDELLQRSSSNMERFSRGGRSDSFTHTNTHTHTDVISWEIILFTELKYK